MGEYQGYILTRGHVTDRGRHFLRFTGAGEDGPFEVIVTRDRPLFFIPAQAALPPALPVRERRSVDLTAFDGSPVDALYFNNQPLLYKTRRALQDMGITTFEADILPEDRFLMERFINGGVSVHGPSRREAGLKRFLDPVLRPVHFQPDFTILSLDIETGQNKELYSIACHFQDRQADRGGTEDGGTGDDGIGIVLIRDPAAPAEASGSTDRQDPGPGIRTGLTGRVHEPLAPSGWMVRLPREKDLLSAFLRVMARTDPDIIIGWHVIGFDLRFLENRFKAHCMAFTLGRNRETPEIRELAKHTWAADIPGRIVLDGPPCLRGAFYSFDNFRLQTVAARILGRGKDIRPDQDKVAEIERRFRRDKRALARYNLLDCTLVRDIFRATGLIDLTWKRASLSGLAMDRVGRSVAAFDHFMLPKIHRHGLVAPNILDIRDIGQAPGGWVFTKSPGFYRQIAVFDFKSLYPSIIRTFNIDPLSRINAGIAPLSTPVGIDFSRKVHVLPRFIADLMEIRATAKKDGDNHLSQAVKILMNSFYGVMGTIRSRFYNPDLSRSITGTGRWLLKITRDYLEENGYTVLYGDTDSVFVQLKPSADHDAAAEGLAQKINRFLTRTIKTRFDLDSRLEIEFEKRFSRFFLPAIRGGGHGAKKRYAGMVERDGTSELVFTGLEFVRSDWTRFARQFQYDLFQRIFMDREVASWIRRTVLDLKSGRHDKDLVYNKRLTKPARDYVKAIPPHVKAALRLPGSHENRREIAYVMTLRGPVPLELPHDDLDYDHYIDKQLKPIADAVLLFLDLSVADIVGGKQLSLF